MRKAVAGIVLTLGALFAPVARGQTFPTTFAPLYCQRGVMIDGYRDQSGAIDERDIVGVVDRPAGLRAVDAQFLYFRMRVDGSPMQGNGLTQFAWGFEVSTDGDPSNYEILISVDGASETVRLYHNTVTTIPDSPADPADQLVMTYPFAQNGRVVDAGPSIFGGGNDAFVDMAVPWSDLEPLGFSPTTIVSIWAATSTSPDRMNGDFACNDGGGMANVPSLSQIAPAPIAADPGHSPGPVGGPGGSPSDGGGGNLIGSSGIEGGPGCSCQVGGGPGGRGALGLVLAAGLVATRRSRRRRTT
jgi:MYXO-CTERM domain-containing protein